MGAKCLGLCVAVSFCEDGQLVICLLQLLITQGWILPRGGAWCTPTQLVDYSLSALLSMRSLPCRHMVSTFEQAIRLMPPPQQQQQQQKLVGTSSAAPALQTAVSLVQAHGRLPRRRGGSRSQQSQSSSSSSSRHRQLARASSRVWQRSLAPPLSLPPLPPQLLCTPSLLRPSWRSS